VVAVSLKTQVASLGAQGMGDMGRVMASAQEALAGRVDGKVLAAAVRSALIR